MLGKITLMENKLAIVIAQIKREVRSLSETTFSHVKRYLNPIVD
jgi:hypothetical protein